MSRVTNVLLSFSLFEDSYEADVGAIYPIMLTINEWTNTRGFRTFGPNVRRASGGNRRLDVAMYAAAFVDFPLGSFLNMLPRLPWIEPSRVQVFVKDHNEGTFRVMAPCVPVDVAQASAENGHEYSL